MFRKSRSSHTRAVKSFLHSLEESTPSWTKLSSETSSECLEGGIEEQLESDAGKLFSDREIEGCQNRKLGLKETLKPKGGQVKLHYRPIYKSHYETHSTSIPTR